MCVPRTLVHFLEASRKLRLYLHHEDEEERSLIEESYDPKHP
jgi:hypothetical protein